jgi:hypothetical protein
VLLAVAGVIGVALLLLLASPRHRAFYLGTAGPERAAPGGPGSVPVAGAAARPPGPGATVPRALLPDAAGRIRVPLSDITPGRWPFDGVPAGWQLKEFAGHALVALVRDGGETALRLTSDRASFALYRDVVVDLTVTPRLAWSWKVTRFPGEGDVRARATDDEAAQVYVVFPRWPSPLSRSDVIGYVWDSRAPVDTRVTSPKADNVRVIVVESGGARGGTWRHAMRNVAEDYAAAFGRKPPRVGKVALMIDSNDTRADAEALFRAVTFLPAESTSGGAPAGSTERRGYAPSDSPADAPHR